MIWTFDSESESDFDSDSTWPSESTEPDPEIPDSGKSISSTIKTKSSISKFK